MIAGGSHGALESVEPMLSPAIWTSIATGRSRAEHGITNFVRYTGVLDILRKRWSLVRSDDREVSALWNWPGPFDKTVGFQGWWASWPAEKVNGWLKARHMKELFHYEVTDTKGLPTVQYHFKQDAFEELQLPSPSRSPIDTEFGYVPVV